MLLFVHVIASPACLNVDKGADAEQPGEWTCFESDPLEMVCGGDGTAQEVSLHVNDSRARLRPAPSDSLTPSGVPTHSAAGAGVLYERHGRRQGMRALGVGWHVRARRSAATDAAR